MPTITDYELFEIPPRLLYLRIETDDGIVGWGEPTGGGHSRIVRTAIAALMDNFVVGEDALPIEDHWQQLYYGGFFQGGPILMSAVSGIDQALHDVKGRHYDLPVYELLGGKARERLRVSQFVGGDQTVDVTEMAREVVDDGITAVKLNAASRIRSIDTPAKIDAIESDVAALRNEVGDDVDVCVDFHGRVSRSMAPRICEAVEQYDPTFVEEPIHPEYNDFLPELRAETRVPLATGERMYTPNEFRRALERGGVDVVQPSVSRAGGITGVDKIAELAASQDTALVPHAPTGPVALAASLHVGAAAPRTLFQQQPLDALGGHGRDIFDDLTRGDPFTFENGFMDVPGGPGLGVEMDEGELRERAQSDAGFRFPVWRHEDGSVARW
jgi:galactonate dehydratase